MNVSMPYLDQGSTQHHTSYFLLGCLNINLCCNETFNLLYLDTQVGVRFSILKSNLDLFCICNLNVSQLLVNFDYQTSATYDLAILNNPEP